jgi:hypothetical protein
VSRNGAGPWPPNEKEAALEAERRAAARQQEAHEWRRSRDALADAAELRALDAAAFALHVRVPPLLDGAIRILWNGWLEDWAEFYEVHRNAIEETDEPLPATCRDCLADYREVLDAFGALFDFATELEARMERSAAPSWRDHASALRWLATFARRHGAAFAKIRASRRQFVAGFPSFERFTVPPGITRH